MCDAAGLEVTHEQQMVARADEERVAQGRTKTLRDGDLRLELDVNDERDALGRDDLVDRGGDGGGGKAGDHGE